MPTVAYPQPSGRFVDKENPGGFSHIPALDGVRGTAILLVLIDHLLWASSHTGSHLFDLIADIRSSTYIGVNLFFALSGFLITGILINTVTIPHFFENFYLRRALRIFPLYYASLLCLLVLTKPLHFVWSGWQYYFLTYTANLALWPRNAPLSLGAFNINHFWSLQVEEQFYLLWPLIIFRVRRLETLARVCYIGCAVIFGIRVFLVVMLRLHIFSNIFLVVSPTFSCADNILFGCCLAILIRTRWRTTVERLAPRVISFSAMILLLLSIPNHGLDFLPNISPNAASLIETIGLSLIGISSAALIAMALQAGSKTERLFDNRFLRFLGKYSYGIYVFHFSIDGFLKIPLRAHLNAHLHSKGLSVLLEGVIVGALSVAVAMLSYHLFEVHFLRLKRYFSYNRAAPVATLTDPA
jgi:peptidoglycan/LPS O-acetylase OafA/YrhL